MAKQKGMSQKEMYESITNKIVEALETDNGSEWVKPWRTLIGNEVRSIDNRQYHGVNQMILNAHQYYLPNSDRCSSKIWGTYKAFKRHGFQIGSEQYQRHADIFYFKVLRVKNKDKSKEKGKDVYDKIPMMRFYRVYNGGQCENWVEPDKKEVLVAWTDDQHCTPIEDRLAELKPKLVFGENMAYYSPITDHIGMPNKEQFDTPVNYYATLLHELTHWTGPRSRANRQNDLLTVGMSEFRHSYAFEELVAELGATFLSSHYNLSNDMAMRQCHIPYLKSWLEGIKGDSKALFKAASLAQKSSNFILGIVPEWEKQESEEETTSKDETPGLDPELICQLTA